MSRATRNIGSGLKMLTSNKESSYLLEFLTDTAYYAANTSKMVVAPYIELGRDKQCGISFGPDTPMVSRKHAALERRDHKITLVNLSATNQTLVNGRPVLKEWPLHNGDEIQLSADGPRIRFFNAPGKGQLKFTDRMKLFAQQSLRPYRFALIGLVLAFAVGIAVAGFLIKSLMHDKEKLKAATETIEKQIGEQKTALTRGDSALVAAQAKQAEQLAAANALNENFQRALASQGQVIDALALSNMKRSGAKPTASGVAPAKTASAAPLGKAWSSVYAVQVFLTIEDRNEQPLELNAGNGKPVPVKDYYLGTGTGFVLEDGRFITSRRWVEPWAYPKDEKDALSLFANFVHHNGGTATVKLVTMAPNGQEFTLSGNQFITDHTRDRVVIGNFGFGEGKIAVADAESGNDWAIYKSLPVTGLFVSGDMVPAKGQKIELHCLGYEIPDGIPDGPAGNPTYTLRKAASGETGKPWVVEGEAPDAGNFGGPALVIRAGKPAVAGMLTAGKTGNALVIPINQIK